MGYGEYESFFVKEEEVHLLLAGTGIKKWYGLTSGGRQQQTREVTREDVYRILGELYQKGYVEWEKESVRLLEPVSAFIEILGKSLHCIKIEKSQEEFLKGCYYVGENLVLLETSKLEPDMLKFSLWSEKDFLAYLWEIDLFPEEELILEGMDGEELLGEEKDQTNPEQRGILTLYDTETGMEEAKMIIEEEGIFTYVMFRTGFTENKKLYRKKECEDILKEWFHREV